MPKPIGERYHEATKITWQGVLADMFVPRPPAPPPFKEFRGPKIHLPPADYEGLSLEEALRRRRSIRHYSPRPMTLKELAQLLFAAQGATDRYDERYLRTAPSAGALYPFEVYVVVHTVAGLDPGLYHYDLRDHSLTLLELGDLRDVILRAGLEQDMLAQADVVFVLAAVVDRVRHKYGERGWRYIYMEAGHISQNIYLQATSLGLGSAVAGAFLDDEVNKIIGADGKHEVSVYLHAVGTR